MRRPSTVLAVVVLAVVIISTGVAQAVTLTEECRASRTLVVGGRGPSCHVAVECPTSVDVDGLPIPVAGCEYTARVVVSGIGLVGGRASIRVGPPLGPATTQTCGPGILTCEATVFDFSPGGGGAVATCAWTNGIALFVTLDCTLTAQVFTGPG